MIKLGFSNRLLHAGTSMNETRRQRTPSLPTNPHSQTIGPRICETRRPLPLLGVLGGVLGLERCECCFMLVRVVKLVRIRVSMSSNSWSSSRSSTVAAAITSAAAPVAGFTAGSFHLSSFSSWCSPDAI